MASTFKQSCCKVEATRFYICSYYSQQRNKNIPKYLTSMQNP